MSRPADRAKATVTSAESRPSTRPKTHHRSPENERVRRIHPSGDAQESHGSPRRSPAARASHASANSPNEMPRAAPGLPVTCATTAATAPNMHPADAADTPSATAPEAGSP